MAAAIDSGNAAFLTDARALLLLFRMLRQEERGSALYSQAVSAANVLMDWMEKEPEAARSSTRSSETRRPPRASQPFCCEPSDSTRTSPRARGPRIRIN